MALKNPASPHMVLGRPKCDRDIGDIDDRMRRLRDGEVAQQLGALTTCAEGLSSIASTCIKCLTHPVTPAPRDFLTSVGTCTHIPRIKMFYLNKMSRIELKRAMRFFVSYDILEVNKTLSFNLYISLGWRFILNSNVMSFDI